MKYRDKLGRFRKVTALEKLTNYEELYQIIMNQLQKELIKARNKIYERTN